MNQKNRIAATYHNMKQRCYNPKAKAYPWYGAKGIAVCEEWRTGGVPVFRAWALANGYRDDLTIDRIDPMKGYSPDNCRFITAQENRQGAVRKPRSRLAPYAARGPNIHSSPNMLDIRRCLGLSQRGLALALGISLRTVQSWEQGRRNPGRWAQHCLAELANENPKRENGKVTR